MRTAPYVLSTVLLLGCSSSDHPDGTGGPVWDGELVSGAADATGARAPALSLTASDGTGLRLSSLELRAALEDPLALTELHLAFENPEARTIEGTFKILLPAGAALSRFAMKTEAGWQEGEVVETQAARRAYEDFLHRKQDPALLEQAPGNEFTARVFPIPAKGTKEIVVTYSQALERAASYSFPLEGLPRLDRFSAQIFGGDAVPVVSERRVDFVPGSDLLVRRSAFSRAGGLRAGEYVMARVIPVLDSTPEALGSTVFLVDTSASRALGIREQTELVARLIASLPAGSRAIVFAFDQTTELVFDGDRAAFGSKHTEQLLQRGALGASNLGRAVTAVGEHMEKNPGAATRLVLVGDGVATTGETDAKKLRGQVESLQRTSLVRFDAIVIGGLRDEPALQMLVRGGLAHDGVVLDAKLGFEELRTKLDRATRSKIPVRVEGSTWSYPTQLDGVQPGDEARIFAQVPVGTVPKVVIGDAVAVEPELHAVSAPLLERAWAATKIRSLTEQPPGGDVDLGRRTVIDLSRRYRVMSPYTSMLVLETDDDYRRFDIDRKAKLDILTISGGHVAVAKASRTGEAVQPATEMGSASRGAAANVPVAPWGREENHDAPTDSEAREAALRDSAEFGMIGLLNTGAGGDDDPMSAHGNMWGESLGAGGLGLSGTGSGGGGQGVGMGSASGVGQGFGAGAGGLAGARYVPSVMVETRPIAVNGRIPSEVVQRILRQNLGRVRNCYATARARNPALAGAVTVRFVIDRTGTAVSPSDGGSTLGSRPAVSCIVRAMNGLTFPEPESGIVKVEQTFVLSFGTPQHDTSMLSREEKVVEKIGPYTGTFAEVMTDLAEKKPQRAVDHARDWMARAPGDVMALVALGEAHEALGNKVQAARAYGSILELFSFRADSRRFAGERLERLDTPLGFELAADAFRGAAAQRPDHPSSHRLLAYSLLRDGRPAEAFEAIERGVKQHYPQGRFAGVSRVLGEDLVLVGMAWTKAEPARAKEIEERMRAASVDPDGERQPSVRFVLVWETDANDVDFHIEDGRGGHAYYANKTLPSGGSLYADVTTGYGPECFTVRGPKASRAYPYKLSAHYFSRGPMGYGMGKLQIIEHDGRGGLGFEERPFVIMRDGAFVDLGMVKAG